MKCDIELVQRLFIYFRISSFVMNGHEMKIIVFSIFDLRETLSCLGIFGQW